MRHGASLLAALHFCAAVAAQDDPPPLLELPAAGLRISVDEYRAHLHAVLGGARLEELVLDRLLTLEVAKLAVETLPADVRTVLDAPDRAAEARLAARIATDFDGQPERYRDYLATIGRSHADELATARLEALRDARIRALVLTRRAPDERVLRRLFEDRYGPGGMQVEVRHLMVSFAEIRERLAAGNRRAVEQQDPAKVEALARQRITELQALLADADAPQPDWQPVPGYRFQRFGVAFAEAARTLEVGEVSAPVRSEAGLHLVRVDGRVVTAFDDVREEIEAAARTAPVSLLEGRRLREELLTRYRVREALARSREGGR